MSLSQTYHQFIEEPGDKLVCSMMLQIDLCQTQLVRLVYYLVKMSPHKS